jgi:hypothetical protein
VDIPALDLSDAVAGHPGAGLADADAGELLDRQALASYRQRLTEIERVAAVDASLGRLVHDAVSTGITCRYDPDPDRPVRWILKA